MKRFKLEDANQEGIRERFRAKLMRNTNNSRDFPLDFFLFTLHINRKESFKFYGFRIATLFALHPWEVCYFHKIALLNCK